MIAMKIGHIFFTCMVAAIGFFVFGVDVAYTKTNLLTWAKAEEGVIFDKSGFLVRINDHWVGIAKMHEGMVDMPIATWLVIGAVLTGLWMILFEWSSSD